MRPGVGDAADFRDSARRRRVWVAIVVQAIADLLQMRTLRLDLIALSSAHDAEPAFASKHGCLELVAHPMLERLVPAHAVDTVSESARNTGRSFRSRHDFMLPRGPPGSAPV